MGLAIYIKLLYSFVIEQNSPLDYIKDLRDRAITSTLEELGTYLSQSSVNGKSFTFGKEISKFEMITAIYHVQACIQNGAEPSDTGYANFV